MKIKRLIKLFGKLLFNIPFAPFTLTKIGRRIYNTPLQKRRYYFLSAIFFFSLFILPIVLCALETIVSGIWVTGLFLYLNFCGCMAVFRRKTRDKIGIEGSIIEDFVVSVLFYPSVAVQLELTTEDLCREEENGITHL